MKANSKNKADSKDDGGAPNGKKKMLGLIIGVALVLAIGGGAGWYWISMGANAAGKEHKVEKAEPPEYVTVEPFTVNLLPENGGDQYLQVQFTLQVANGEAAEQIKSNMALVRSRVLLILSGKHASEINTIEGKKLLAKQIADAIKQPFFKGGEPQKVGDVLFTAFIIQ